MSICFNGSQVGYFTCSNGVRQGDPLSPLLFCIVEDVLSRGIAHLFSNDRINLSKTSKNYFIPSHTLFADDIMVFCRGGQKSLLAISNLLEEYGSFSGQFCNPSKSLIYAGGMTESRHNCLAATIGFSKADPLHLSWGFPFLLVDLNFFILCLLQIRLRFTWQLGRQRLFLWLVECNL